MKFLTVFAFACVAAFVVLHSAYGSPLPEPVPDPSPVADPKPKAEPSPDPEPVASPKAEANANPLPAASPVEPKGAQTAGGDANFVALSANADPMVPAPGAAAPKMDEAQA
ncbi:eumenine mastoparan-OD [Drosophila biarmipes]|uniref:eumenine mastoparan-OD n=1 Tax=Drosophila biarmipes TaxID=125945 RepID=UPI0007E7F7F6|nr:eumenine mastoparan-OD [Drosophila biarmipes]